MKKTLLLLLLFINSLLSEAPVISQDHATSTAYPKGYFRNPLGIAMQLAANFGELRANHFHMGFDIRTNQRENLPVYAAAEGFISRIKIERFGFGRAIYITHPNGFTTVYAHLNDFFPSLQSYLIDKQYADQLWEQEVTFESDQFPVAKGQFIAYSGNTGGSQGPHLHFEIRDTKTGNNLNPWLFDFGISDKVPPLIYRLYLYDRRYSTYDRSPVAIPLKGTNGKYATRDTMLTLSSPYVSFGISAEDKTSVSPFRFGIYEASLFVDDSLQSSFQLNDISYNDTRYINGSIDYKIRLSGGSYIQHLSRLPGNYSSIFSGTGDGSISLSDTLVHKAEILINDAGGNSSVLAFKFRLGTLKSAERMAGLSSIPLVPGRENIVKAEDFEATFSYRAFYDTVPFVLRSVPPKEARVVSLVHYLNNYTIPVHDSFTVRIKPVVSVSDSLKERIVMHMVSNHKVELVKGSWDNDMMEAKFRDLGIFKLLLDTIPARIATTGWTNGSNVRNRRSISLIATDNAGEIKSFNAYSDGQWLLFSRRKDSFIHTFDERTAAGTHQLKVIVEDIAGNTTEKNYRFTR